RAILVHRVSSLSPFYHSRTAHPQNLHSFPTRRSSDLSKTGWQDFHARQYDPALGRWFANDPKGSLMPNISNYAAMMDNPTTFIEDRKSTRLNSSHVKISYAVFCLKKKNKNNIV